MNNTKGIDRDVSLHSSKYQIAFKGMNFIDISQ